MLIIQQLPLINVLVRETEKNVKFSQAIYVCKITDLSPEW